MEGTNIDTSRLSETTILFVILAVGFLAAGLLIWRMRGVLAKRLPQPFLGDGPNVEWAETKRVEISTGVAEAYGEPSEIAKPESNQADSANMDLDGDLPGSRAKSLEQRNPNSGQSPSAEDLILLDGWLDKTAHPEDEWAKRLLDRSETAEEPP